MSTKQDIFNYVMNTPGNTNPAILESLLDKVDSENSGVSIPAFTINNETGDDLTFIVKLGFLLKSVTPNSYYIDVDHSAEIVVPAKETIKKYMVPRLVVTRSSVAVQEIYIIQLINTNSSHNFTSNTCQIVLDGDTYITYQTSDPAFPLNLDLTITQ